MVDVVNGENKSIYTAQSTEKKNLWHATVLDHLFFLILSSKRNRSLQSYVTKIDKLIETYKSDLLKLLC